MKAPAVRDIEPVPRMTVSGLVSAFAKAGGFTARHIAEGVAIWRRMLDEKGCLKFLSFPACIMATGTRGVLVDIVRNRLADVLVTTCGTLDHDLARLWGDYREGDFAMDDALLWKKGYHRLGNVLVPVKGYGPLLENHLRPWLREMYDAGMRRFSTVELCRELGRRVAGERGGKKTLLYWAWKNSVPIVIPGITDGAVGSQLWLFSQEKRDITVDVLRDEDEMARLVFGAKRAGAIVIGGGISKHHTLWWNQFRDGLDYAVYITTAVEYDGSLSGARVREAVSWGKVKAGARRVTIDCDATIALPLMVAAL